MKSDKNKNDLNLSKKNPSTYKIECFFLEFVYICQCYTNATLAFTIEQTPQQLYVYQPLVHIEINCSNSSFSLSRSKHGTKKYIGNRPVEEAKSDKNFILFSRRFVRLFHTSTPLRSVELKVKNDRGIMTREKV